MPQGFANQNQHHGHPSSNYNFYPAQPGNPDQHHQILHRGEIRGPEHKMVDQ